MDAQLSRRLIFDNWTYRNKHKAYSKKLNTMIFEALELISKFPDRGRLTDIDALYLIKVNHFQISYKVNNDSIIVLKLWDHKTFPLNK